MIWRAGRYRFVLCESGQDHRFNDAIDVLLGELRKERGGGLALPHQSFQVRDAVVDVMNGIDDEHEIDHSGRQARVVGRSENRDDISRLFLFGPLTEMDH